MPNGKRSERIKSSSKQKKHVSNYNKRQMLAMLKDSNCHPKELETMLTRFRVDESVIKGFVNEQAELAQSRMEQTLRSQHNKHFMNLEEIAGNLLEHEDCATDNTLPVTLEAIANFEKHPSPSDVNGVDLKVLYQMLANMTAGYPVDDIEHGPTKDFLKQCYTDLMDSVSEMDGKALKSSLSEQDKQTRPVYSWLCNSDYSQYLLKLFKDSPTNNDNDDE